MYEPAVWLLPLLVARRAIAPRGGPNLITPFASMAKFILIASNLAFYSIVKPKEPLFIPGKQGKTLSILPAHNSIRTHSIAAAVTKVLYLVGLPTGGSSARHCWHIASYCALGIPPLGHQRQAACPCPCCCCLQCCCSPHNAPAAPAKLPSAQH